MRRRIRHGRNQGNCRGATANDHHLLAGIIQIGGPVLRVDTGPSEVLDPGKLGQVTRLVVVVTGATDQKVAGVDLLLTADRISSGDRPELVLTGPVSTLGGRVEADPVSNPEFFCGITDVVADGVATGKHLEFVPGPELVAEGEHVRIRADTRVAEQIPGAAHGRTFFQHDKALVRTGVGKVAGHADTGQARANDNYIEMFSSHIIVLLE